MAAPPRRASCAASVPVNARAEGADDEVVVVAAAATAGLDAVALSTSTLGVVGPQLLVFEGDAPVHVCAPATAVAPKSNIRLSASAPMSLFRIPAS
jgi:hypothetical protein